MGHRILFLLWLAWMLVGCATTRKYESRLDEWVGRDSKELVKSWGEPNRIHTFGDGRKAYEYRFMDKHMDQSRWTASEPKGGAAGCITYFVINAATDAVLSWKWEGDDCRAK